MALTDEQYLDWIYDPRRNQARLFLVEIDHSAGTLYFGSHGWMDETYQPYDDWIKGKPVMEDSLDDFLGIGDMDIINMDDAVNWLALNFRGHECRWYYGDVAWPKADFRQIATSMLGGCRLLTEKLYRFDLLDRGSALNKLIGTGTSTQSGTVKQVCDWVMTQAGLPAITYLNLDSPGRNMAVSVDITPTSKVDAVLKLIAGSVGGYVRINQTGGTEVYRPNTLIEPEIVLNNDNIGYRKMAMTEVTPAYQKVIVTLYDNTSVDDTTTAPTGSLDEEITINTQLTSTGEATTILAEKVEYHDTVHSLWEIPVLDVGGMIQVGDRIKVDHENLYANGTVKRISRSPLSPPFTYLDLIV